jgi:hypothetical protein
MIEVWLNPRMKDEPDFTFEPTHSTVIGHVLEGDWIGIYSQVKDGYNGANRHWVFPASQVHHVLVTELVQH